MPHIVVRSLCARATAGTLFAGHLRLRCALGRAGISARKREGDGATPAGRLPLRSVHFRADNVRRFASAVSLERIAPGDGWCDDPGDRNYNRAVRHPYPASAERMWRADCLYDIVAVLGHNDRPRRRGRGSAIFMHIAREGYAPTEGCIALAPHDLGKVLRLADRRTLILAGASLPPIPKRRLKSRNSAK